MKKIFSQLVVGAILGVGIGFILSIVASLNSGTGEFYATSQALIDKFDKPIYAVMVTALANAVIGAVSVMVSGRVFYNVKSSKSDVVKTITHMLSMALVFLVVGAFLGSYKFNLFSIIVYLIVTLSIYYIIWTILFLIERGNIQKINEKLQNHNKS